MNNQIKLLFFNNMGVKFNTLVVINIQFKLQPVTDIVHPLSQLHNAVFKFTNIFKTLLHNHSSHTLFISTTLSVNLMYPLL